MTSYSVNSSEKLNYSPFLECFPRNNSSSFYASNVLSHSYSDFPQHRCFSTKKKSAFQSFSNLTLRMQAIQRVIQKIFQGRPLEAFKIRSEEEARILADDPCDGLDKARNQLLNLSISECACRLFDRFTTSIREDYEDIVIENAMNIIFSQLLEKGFFNINLVLYMPGKLASEVILLTRLVKKINEQGVFGRFNISIIDPEYKGVALHGKATRSDFQSAINDFQLILGELSVQTGVDFSPITCFESAKDYEATVRDTPSFSYDLFIASDLGAVGPDTFDPIARNTRKQCCPTHQGTAIVMYGVSVNGKEKTQLWKNGHANGILRKLRVVSRTSVHPITEQFSKSHFKTFLK